MAKNRQYKNCQMLLASTLVVGVALTYSATHTCAQNITLDGTLGTTETLTGPNYEIPQASGKTVGNNLFHSFGKFNLNADEAAIFESSNNIRNILSRVTGGTPSAIDGLIRTLGSDVNFFLINPNGIIFGKNARLDISGSFVASTANAIQFGNLGFFSATDKNLPSPLLTINPNALLFNQISQNAVIQNNSIAPAGIDQAGFEVFGLRVPHGKSLLLVGGNVSMDGGWLNTFGGKVELGGLAEPGNVNLLFDGNNFRLGFPDNVSRASVSLTNQARVFVEAAGGGDITVNARNIEILGVSRLFAGIKQGLGTPETFAGDINLNATEEIKVADNSGMFNLVRPGSKGNAGNITISSGSISLTDNADVSASTFGQGNAGNVSVRASNSVELVNASIFNNVESSGVGNGGTININAASLSLKNSALLIASTFGQGNAGNVTLTVKDAISLAGAYIFSTVEAGGEGKGGNININAASLSLQDGAQLLTSVRGASGNQPAGKGNLGNITVDVTGRMTIAGGKGRVRSGIFNVVGSGATGNGGNITISSSSISLTDDGQVSASTFGQGNAGSVSVRASDSVEIVDAGILGTVESSGVGNGGTININAAALSLKDGAQLLTSVRGASNNLPDGRGNAGNITVDVAGHVNIAGTKGGFVSGILSRVNRGATGDGGNITISSNSFSLTDNAQVSARTSGQGNAGSITITTNAFEAMTGGQLITTTSSNFDAGIITLKVEDNITLSGSDTGIFANTEPGSIGNGGTIIIDPKTLTIRDGAKIAVDSQGEGTGGDIQLLAGFLTLDNGTISAETRSNTGGDIKVNLQDLLLLRNGSKISTTAGNQQFGGDGGNIAINSPFVVAVPRENSDITANAFTGQGGRVDITANGIFGILPQERRTQLSDITASSELGVSGQVTIITPDVDPSRGLVELPTNLVDASGQIASGCSPKERQTAGRFIATGRGGLPLSPHEPLRGRAVITNWVNLPPATSATQSTPQLVEAQGWIVDAHNNVILVAQSPQMSSAATCAI